MRRKFTISAIVLAALALITVFAVNFVSDDNLKVALGIKNIPSSVTNQHTNEHAFTDEMIEVYFESSPADMSQILAARKYERMQGIPAAHVTPQSIYPLRMSRYFPNLPVFDVVEIYQWESQTKDSFCTIWINETHTKAFVEYSAD